MPRLTYNGTGGVMKVGDEVAERLLKTGLWSRLDDNAQKSNDEETPEVQQVPDVERGKTWTVAPEANEDAPERPAAAVVRAWAKNNDVEVPDKGRVPDEVYEQYANAHKE